MSTPLDCRRAEELLSDHVEGTLTFAQHTQLDTHLQDCDACRELREAVAEVIEALRATADIEPSADLAERAASAALRAGRVPPRVRPLPQLAGIPHRILATAAVLTLALSSGLVAASGGAGAGALAAPSRVAQRVSAIGVSIAEARDRLMGSLEVVRVVVGTAFEGRMDRVNDRIEDYRRLLERRREQERERGDGAPIAPAASPTPGATPLPEARNPNPAPTRHVPEIEKKERSR